MHRSHIPGFPHRMPSIDWLTYLPKSKDDKGDDVALHLIKFCMHARKLKVEWHEDVHGFSGRKSEVLVREVTSG